MNNHHAKLHKACARILLFVPSSKIDGKLIQQANIYRQKQLRSFLLFEKTFKLETLKSC